MDEYRYIFLSLTTKRARHDHLFLALLLLLVDDPKCSPFRTCCHLFALLNRRRYVRHHSHAHLLNM